MRQFTRKEILDDLHEKIARKEALCVGGAGAGLVAKAVDEAGIDIIMTYGTGPFRMDGLLSSTGTLPYGDCNEIIKDLGRRLLAVVKKTPVIGGTGTGNPYVDNDRLIDEMMELGFSGLTTVPTVGGVTGPIRKRLDAEGYGIDREIEFISKCNQKNVFSIAYTYTFDEIRRTVAAGADLVSPHFGLTVGGQMGSNKAFDIDEACEKAQKMMDVAREENPDIIVIVHGGPFSTPENVQICYDRTDMHGFMGASSIERLPYEKAITDTIADLKTLRTK